MNPADVSRFAQRSAALRAEIHGVLVVYRKRTVRLACASRDDLLQLEDGGAIRERTARLRIPVQGFERPEIGESVVVVKTSLAYVIRRISDPAETAAEWVVELSQP